MYVSKKVIIAIAAIILGLTAWYFYDRAQLKSEYVDRLNEIEDQYINEFYHSSIKGTISYIKKYQDESSKYVFSVKDSTGDELTIGKVQITNFFNVKEGDFVEKKAETFELRIISSGAEIIATVKYE